MPSLQDIAEKDIERALQCAVRDSIDATRFPVAPLTNLLAFASRALNGPAREDLLSRIRSSQYPRTRNGAGQLGQDLREQLKLDAHEPIPRLPQLLSEQTNILVIPIDAPGLIGGTIGFNTIQALLVPANPWFSLYGLAYALSLLCRTGHPHGKKPNCSICFDHGTPGAPPLGSNWFCTRAALELLIPAPGLAESWRVVREHLGVKRNAPGDVELFHLARVFGVSLFAVSKRCEHLNLLPEGGAWAIQRFIVQEFGSVQDREAQLELPDGNLAYLDPEPRQLLAPAFEFLRESGLNPNHFARFLGWDANFVRRARSAIKGLQ